MPALAPARHAHDARGRPSTGMRRRRHAPLGRCLFCLAKGVPLTEEHLVPRALGGRLTLRDAVCEPCRRITGRHEQLTLDREFAVPKTLLALK
ncbi:MAG TPA: HNH endonuclease, partial [Burkholderiaceae bacterium]